MSTAARMGGEVSRPPAKVNGWSQYSHGSAYECRVWLCQEDTGFSAIAIRLPGVASQGETEQKAIENIKDAFKAAVLAYAEETLEIPWEDNAVERPINAKEFWVVVCV